MEDFQVKTMVGILSMRKMFRFIHSIIVTCRYNVNLENRTIDILREIELSFLVCKVLQ